jgi:RHH-type proline utilization regulon transcriptional repressor/proline dehydrogenase/delta 1-pyrroline-5-carboxylate dehydrogenase
VRPGLSVKLSALDPRFEPIRRAELLGHAPHAAAAPAGSLAAAAYTAGGSALWGAGAAERSATSSLVAKVTQLATLAADAGVDLTIDAEEASRLELQLDIAAAVSANLARTHPGWDGLGLAVQAYQRRAAAAVDWLADVARRDGRRFKMRLVKGAYWDTEVKVAQVLGLPTFPVYTRKEATDVSYAACAAKVGCSAASVCVCLRVCACMPACVCARARGHYVCWRLCACKLARVCVGVCACVE